MQHDYDLIIIGAGMVGASLACALAPTGLRIAIIESVEIGDEQQPSYDDRGITLAPSSKRILEHIGVWQKCQADVNPIKHIHVSEQGRFGFTRLSADEIGHAALGYVVVARALGQALHRQMATFENVHLICPAELKHFQTTEEGVRIEFQQSGQSESLTAGLMVGADGSNSLVRRMAGINTKERDFKQTAIVANITTQKNNKATAYERFTRHGPVALLPISENRSVLVFTVLTEDADRHLAMTDPQFINAIEAEFGRRLGKIMQVGRRRSYPIKFIEVQEQVQDNLVLLGNAAHSIHPNAAQGFNLGLRDVAGLAECFTTALKKGFSLDDEGVLQDYLSLRLADQKRTMRLSNGLASSFYNDLPLLGPARNLAMLLVDTLPGLKSRFAEQAMGIAGLQPRLVRGMSL